MIHQITVRLVTPAMIGGAKARELDHPATIRPPSIRGQLRFWTRALAAGAGLNVYAEESALWGNTEGGQGVVILPPLVKTLQSGSMTLFPHKTGGRAVRTRMLLPSNPAFTLRFRLQPHQTHLREKFQAVLWTWLNLGTIGRRSRRGYGSLFWEPQPDDALHGFTEAVPADLESPTQLTQLLNSGCSAVRSAWGAPGSAPRSLSPFFQLRSIDQIFVGQILRNSAGIVLREFDDSSNGIQYLIHGLNEAADPGAATPRKEMGHAGRAPRPWGGSPNFPPRHASPMLWRLFPCGGGFVPVLIWSPFSTTTIPPGTQVHSYLSGSLQIGNSLWGKPL